MRASGQLSFLKHDVVPDMARSPLLLVLPHLRPGGIESGTVRLSGALAARGWPVRLLLGAREGALVDLVAPGVELADLGGRGAMASVPRLRAEIASARAVWSGTNARNVAVLLAAASLPAGRRPPVLISEHTAPEAYLASARGGAVRRALLRRLYPRADALLAPLPGLGEAWRSALGLEARPVVAALPNPVLGPDELGAVTRLEVGGGATRDPDLVVAVGRLDHAKGHDLAIRALAHARVDRPALRLVIHGEGPEAGRLAALAAGLGQGGAVTLAGLTRDPVGAFAGAGAAVLGSRREGFGNVVVEALAAGTPVVATDCDGPRALLAGLGAGGRIVARGDAEALGAALAATCGAPAALAAAAGPGRDRARRYTVGAAADAFVAVLAGHGVTGG